jgi:hypothetical protein
VYPVHHYNPTTQFATPAVATNIVNGVVNNCLGINSTAINSIKSYIKT